MFNNRLVTIAPTTQPVVDTAIYAAIDLIGKNGAPLAFTAVSGAVNAMLVSVLVTDAAKQSAALDLVFYSTALPGTTLTDNAVFAPVAADAVNYIGHVNILAANYSIFNANSAAVVKDINLPLVPASSGTGIYAVIVSRGTPTYVAASDLKVYITVLRG